MKNFGKYIEVEVVPENLSGIKSEAVSYKAWNFRKQNQIQPLSKQKKIMGKGEAFIWKKDLKH